jgi:hypothetical protein
VDGTGLRAQHQDLLVEVELLQEQVLVQAVHVARVLAERVRVAEREVYFLLLAFEYVLKRALQLASLPQYELRLGLEAFPRFAFNSIYGSIGLIIFGLRLLTFT